MNKRYLNKALSIIYPICVAVLIITFSIGLPIYFRPFYYMQIEPLGLPEYTGVSYEKIKEAYDEVLDYLVFPGGEFSSGVFKFSEEGASHFADCKGLFTLNGVALAVSLLAVVTISVLNSKGKIQLAKPKGFPLWSWAGAGVLGVFAVIGILCAVDFDTAFRVFHAVFFPGKDNWLFNPWEDQIILVMPEEFFMSCGILILSSVLLLSISVIVAGALLRRRANGEKMN